MKYILSDVIVLWRAWVLWNRRFLLFIPPLIYLVCTLGRYLLDILQNDDDYFPPGLAVTSAMYYFLESNQVNRGKGLATLARSGDFFILGTNLWATGLIFIRTWYVTFKSIPPVNWLV
jgi:hypothetical protein